MNHHRAEVELPAESVVSTAEPNLINYARFHTSCCYRAAAELNSSYLVLGTAAARRMSWALISPLDSLSFCE